MLFISLCQRRHSSCFLKLHPKLTRNYSHAPTPPFPEDAERFRILFMGRDQFSCLVLQELYKAKDVWKELAIATQPDSKVGRNGSVLAISSLKTLGHHLKLPVHPIPKTKWGFKNWVIPAPFTRHEDGRPSPPNHLLVTASFGRILPSTMLESFQPSRRFNIHPSLLPAYRGAAPIQHSIINDEKKTGVCVIEMLKRNEGIDAGSIWGCKAMDVPEHATYEQLRDDLAVLGGQLLVSVLRDTMKGKAISTPQENIANAPLAPMITSKDAFANFNDMTAQEIYRRFRAINHQKQIFTHTTDGKILQLRQLEIPDPTSLANVHLSLVPGSATYFKAQKMILIRCKDQSILGVTMVKPEGKADRVAFEFWTGLRPVKGGSKEVLLGIAPSS